jgi:hypothetical protein
MKTLIAILVCVATFALAQAEKKIIPVDAWPRVLQYDGKICYGPDVGQCVSQGYRLKQPMPATPTGKQIVKVEWEQDAKADMCKAKVTYEDAPPAPPPPAPEILVEVPATNIVFYATSNGVARSWAVKSAATNTVEK